MLVAITQAHVLGHRLGEHIGGWGSQCANVIGTYLTRRTRGMDSSRVEKLSAKDSEKA